MSRIRTNFITNRFANGAPTVSNGLIIAGVTTFTGPIAGIAGTVSGTTKFDNISVSGVTTSIGTFHIRPSNGALSPKISYVDSIAEALIFADNVEARFGVSSDLRIYHDSNHSYIDDTGTGNLKLRSNNFRVSNADESKISATFQPAAGVELYYDNTSRMSTASYGIAVNGNILFQEELVHIGDTDTKIKFPSTGDTISFETAGSEQVRISSNGSVGIGTVNPNTRLHIHHPTTNGVALFESSDAYCHLIFKDSGSDDSNKPHFGVQGDDFRFVNGGAQNLRITSTGHLLTGGLDNWSFNNNSANTKVFEITGEGTDDKYGVINISGNTNSTAAIGAIKFINRENSNPSSGSNAGSRNVATIDVFADTSDSNAGDDSGGYIRFNTKSEAGNLTERMRISSAGYVSGNVNAPCWFGSQDTQHNVANASYTRLINLGNDVTNPSSNNGGWNESTGTFTVQAGQAGTYFIFGGGGIDDIQANDYTQLRFYKNGSGFGPYARHTNGGGSNQLSDCRHHMITNLNEGDYVDLRIYHNEGSTEPTEPNRCFFGGYRISL